MTLDVLQGYFSTVKGIGMMTTGSGYSAIERVALLRLLEIKDVDIRIGMLEQARTAVDRGVHAGGAFSALIPLATLYYSGLMRVDVENPTSTNQDYFVLSKGHAVAPLAAIYADLGFFDRSILSGSRSVDSILNGHPGPLLPGVHTATGPMGQGICVAGGMAVAGQMNDRFDVFAITGDGELQEGTVWEAVMYAATQRSDNLCVVVDNNHGQLDNPTALHLNMAGIADQFRAFGWRVYEVEGTRYDQMYDALYEFKHKTRDGRPTAIISRTWKGWGGFTRELVKHKTNLPDSIIDPEIALQKKLRESRVREYLELRASVDDSEITERLDKMAESMNLRVARTGIEPVEIPVRTKAAPPRDKKIQPVEFPKLDPEKSYATDEVVSMAMREYAKDPRVVSIDSDLSSTSGLQRGVGAVDQRRALNVGIAEANMMAMGEGFAILGYNVWVSTFCPFFNWNILRRIAVSYQERREVIDAGGGWLTEGHGLDLTFLATAPNFETKTNGATHMGNDDTMVYSGIAHLKIIDVSCPNLLFSVMRWIMEGNRGLVYVRVMRSASPVIYGDRPRFEFGKAYPLRGESGYDLTIVSSGRGVHEAIAAATLLAERGVTARVIDMPSVDESVMLSLHDEKKPAVFAEQNNGFLFSEFRRVCFAHRRELMLGHIHAINALDEGKPRFIHSATYDELLAKYRLSPEQIADACEQIAR